MSKLSKVYKNCHYEGCKDAEASIAYCMKEESRIEGPVELGERPFKRNSKLDWDKAY